MTLKERIPSKICILPCFVYLKSVPCNLLCVCVFFCFFVVVVVVFGTPESTLFQIFFFQREEDKTLVEGGLTDSRSVVHVHWRIGRADY